MSLCNGMLRLVPIINVPMTVHFTSGCIVWIIINLLLGTGTSWDLTISAQKITARITTSKILARFLALSNFLPLFWLWVKARSSGWNHFRRYSPDNPLFC